MIQWDANQENGVGIRYNKCKVSVTVLGKNIHSVNSSNCYFPFSLLK